MNRLFSFALGLLSTCGGICFGQLGLGQGPGRGLDGIQVQNEPNFLPIKYKIVYESFRTTKGRDNWELCMINPDGTGLINLTNTPALDELYPHVTNDGKKICFVVDSGTGRRATRSVCYMNIDGTGRRRVAGNAREPCFSGDGKSIAYLKGEFDRFTTREYATEGLVLYDIATRKHNRHINDEIYHMYAICWSPDNDWFLGVVHGGMEYSDAILAFQADGKKIFDLKKFGVIGCRPDFSRDGKHIAWGKTDWELCMGDIQLTGPEPTVTSVRRIIGCDKGSKIYHVDLSPDGKYIAFSFGSDEGSQQMGSLAEGWNIYISDLNGRWIQVTTDGKHNKEPDWVPVISEP